MALFVGPVFLNKIRRLCLFAGGGSHRRGGFFLCAGVGGRRPSPPQRASTSCAPPPPEGEGDGRGKGRGLRAEAPGEEGPGSGQARRGTGQSPHAPEAGPPEHRPEERPKGRRGGNGGPRPPVWALARQGGGRGCRDRPGAARERPRRGRGQATADPRQRRGLPMRPTLFAPAQTPGGGEHGASGARSGGQGGGSRRKAGPQLRPPDAPLQGAPSPRDGVRRKRKAPRPWPGRFREGKLLAESTPCGSIVPQRRRCCQAPEGGGPLLDIRTLFRQRGALTGLCLGLPRPGRDDVPFPSAS